MKYHILLHFTYEEIVEADSEEEAVRIARTGLPTDVSTMDVSILPLESTPNDHQQTTH